MVSWLSSWQEPVKWLEDATCKLGPYSGLMSTLKPTTLTITSMRCPSLNTAVATRAWTRQESTVRGPGSCKQGHCSEECISTQHKSQHAKNIPLLIQHAMRTCKPEHATCRRPCMHCLAQLNCFALFLQHIYTQLTQQPCTCCSCHAYPTLLSLLRVKSHSKTCTCHFIPIIMHLWSRHCNVLQKKHLGDTSNAWIMRRRWDYDTKLWRQFCAGKLNCSSMHADYTP